MPGARTVLILVQGSWPRAARPRQSMTNPTTNNSSNSPKPAEAHREIRIVGNPAILEALRKAALFAQWRAKV